MAGQILIVDPIAINRIVLRSRVAAACHNVIQACNAEDATRHFSVHRPDLVLIGPGNGAQASCDLTRALRQDQRSKRVPVLVLSSRHDPQLLRKVLCAGAEDMLDPKTQSVFLLARIRRLLRQRDALEELAARNLTDRELGLAEVAPMFQRPGRIALVTSNDITTRAWETALKPLMPHKIIRASHQETLSALSTRGDIDMFIVQENPDQPDETLRFLAELRSRSELRTAAVLIVANPEAAHGDSAENRLAMTLDIGANDILRHGFDAAELALRVDAHLLRKREDDQLRNQVSDELRIAVRDPLTGLHNRRYALPHLTRIANRSAQTGRSFAVLMVDIDRFKTVNDTYGHSVGDKVLVEVAARLRDNIRKQDLLARMGGEEFLIAMPDTDLPRAQMVADRICRLVREHAVHIANGAAPVHVTVSLGIAMSGKSGTLETPPGDSEDRKAVVEDLLERADQALYDAKSLGRDTYIVGRSAA